VRIIKTLKCWEEVDTIDPDYIRCSTLELICCEVLERPIPGEAAEVGVYRGNFSSLINKFLPDRQLYLFDTFEGFDEQEKNFDIENKFTKHPNDFSDTSIDEVLRKMTNKENCIVKKGHFPDTAQNIDKAFCFVSLDADLYSPTKAGLEFFWPRLSIGGTIMVHDYNNNVYLGVRKAVQEFSEENNIGYISLADNYGTAIFIKS